MKKAILLAILLMMTVPITAQSIRSFVERQIALYPKARLLDIYKSCFQDYMGAEHLVSDTASVRKYLGYELSKTNTDDLPDWYDEPCGINGDYIRVSIRTIKEGIISADQLFDAFIRSANTSSRPSVDSWKQRWHEIDDSVASMNISLPHYAEDNQYIDSILSVGKYAISHSPEYRDAYHPHYRIISREIFEREIEPLIERHERSYRQGKLVNLPFLGSQHLDLNELAK